MESEYNQYGDMDIERLAALPAPEAIASERVILGAVLQDYRGIRDLPLKVENFYLDSHRRIWRAMLEMLEDQQAIDIITLTDHLRPKGEISVIGGVAYLASLTEGLPRNLNLLDHAKLVVDKYLMRAIRQVAYSTYHRAMSGEDWSIDLINDYGKELVRIKEETLYPWTTRTKRDVLVDAMEFSGKEARPIEWVVTGLIQKGGNGLILAAPKTGKSLLMADLAVHLASGTPWLGQFIPRRMVTALVSREDYPGLTAQRITAIVNSSFLDTKHLAPYLWLNTRAQTETFSLGKPDDVDEIIEALQERKVEFAIFDVFRRLWEGNENDNEEVAKVLAALTRIQTQCKCALALIHHVNKSDGQIFQRTRGSSAIDGWSEWGFGISNEPGANEEEATKKVEFYTKASASHQPIHFRIAGQETGLRIERCEAPEPPKKTTKVIVVEKKSPPTKQPSMWQDPG